MKRSIAIGIIATVGLGVGISATARYGLLANEGSEVGAARPAPPESMAAVLGSAPTAEDALPAELYRQVAAQGIRLDTLKTHLLYNSNDRAEAVWLSMDSSHDLKSAICIVHLAGGSGDDFSWESPDWTSSTACTSLEFFASQGIVSFVGQKGAAESLVAVLPDDLAAVVEKAPLDYAEVHGNVLVVTDIEGASRAEPIKIDHDSGEALVIDFSIPLR